MIFSKKNKSFDYIILVFITILVVVGLFAIYSATVIKYDRYYVNKQLLYFMLGIIIIIIISFIDYSVVGEYYLVFYFINIVLLLGVIFMGSESHSATRWLSIGPIRIQPSEFSKIIMIFCTAKYIEKKSKNINNIFTLLSIFVFVGVPFILIKEQPDLSTSLVLLVILAAELYVAKIDYRYILTVLVIGIAGIYILLLDIQSDNPRLLEGYQRDRILAVIHPEEYSKSEYYQTNNSLRAIGSGQLEGKGLLNGSLHKLQYLPEPHTDFIYSVIGEEFGFIGCTFVLFIMLLLLLRCIWIAKDSKDLFGKLIIAGVVGMISFQTFVNIGVVTGILPNTGLPLPFVSSGGSALLSNMIGMGLVVSISMRRRKIII